MGQRVELRDIVRPHLLREREGWRVDEDKDEENELANEKKKKRKKERKKESQRDLGDAVGVDEEFRAQGRHRVKAAQQARWALRFIL